jgi:hypothetical protein
MQIAHFVLGSNVFVLGRMRGKRTREEEGHDKRQQHNERWTDGGTIGWEAAKDKRQQDNQRGQT